MAQHGGSTIYQKESSLFTTTFLLFSFRTSAVPPFNVTSGVFWKATNLLHQSYKVGSSLAGGPAIRLRDTSWRLAPSSPVGWRRGPEFEAHTITKASISTSQGFFRISLTKKSIQMGSSQEVFNYKLQRCYDGNHPLKLPYPLQKLGNHEEFAEKSETGLVCSMYGIFNPTACHKK